MKFYCPLCLKPFKWYEIVLWGENICDNCYNQIKIPFYERPKSNS